MTSRRHPAFTLIELLVVVGVIAILIGAIITVGTSVIAGGRTRDTEAMLKTLDLAVEQFKEDMLERPRFKRQTKKDYDSRYAANYPPDELEVFTKGKDFGGNFLPSICPNPLDDLTNSTGSPLRLDEVQHRSTKAMALAIQLYSENANAILEKVSTRFRKTTGDFEGLQRQGTGGFQPYDPLTYFVDSWGTAIEYFATNTTDDKTPFSAMTDIARPPPVPADGRRQASTVFVEANNGKPFFVSYGADGREQFEPDFIADQGETDLVADYWGNPVRGSRPIEHRFNVDNVYSNPELIEKFAAGLPDPEA